MFKKEVFLILIILFIFSDFSIKESNIFNNRVVFNPTMYILDIPKINIYKKMYISKIDSSIKNIVIFEEFGRPNYISNTVIGAHSGNGKYSYFKDLYKMNINDNFFIRYENTVDKYIIFSKFFVNQYDIEILYKNYDYKVITFITCKNNDSSKRLILLGKIVS